MNTLEQSDKERGVNLAELLKRPVPHFSYLHNGTKNNIYGLAL